MKDYPGGLPKMTPRSLGSLLVFLPLTLAAQSLQERAIALNNWAAPRHLKRSQLHSQQRVATPKLQLPGSATTDDLVFVPLKPCRLADTRPSQPYPALGTTPLAPLTPRTLTIAGSCGVESTGFLFPGPEAFSLNVTAVPPAGNTGGYLLVYPNPITPIPLVASFTWNPGASFQSNAVVSAASPGGSVNVVANATTDVVIDINGYYAAPSDVKGDTALGTGALNSDTSGSYNTAFGYFALLNNTTGTYNTAVGQLALAANTIATDNTGVGYDALEANITGTDNTAVGYEAMKSLTGIMGGDVANFNTALGSQALQANITGGNNTAIGASALQNTTGDLNTAVGWNALETGASASLNTAVGAQALEVSSGSYNIGIGDAAGIDITTGSYNIMIGNQGMSSDDSTIRIGDGQTSTYIAGISGVNVSGAAVVVNANGQLGVTASSRRYKDDIQDMGDASKGLLRLRPVTFHYKKADYDGSKPLEYGLIAEEVADVYPELVVRGTDGQIQSIQYQKLPAMLLNELQKEHRNAEEQAHHIQQQDETIKKLEVRLAALEAQLATSTAK
jgi:hypothetical protein